MASTDRAILLSLLVGCHGGPSPVTADLAAPPPVPAPPDAGTPTPYVPAAAQAELIFTGPQGVATPPTWNAHLPKLAGDGAFLYAAHTHFPDAVAARFTAILRRPAAGGAWTEAARISYPHQPPGLVMDTAGRLHVVFDCLRPADADVTCFQGGAGTGGRTSRFYHLTFSARDDAGALRFDTYANYDEWTQESNGYLGISTASDGTTLWSLAAPDWTRVVQYRAADAMSGTVASLGVSPRYLLYPILAPDPRAGAARLVLFAGEFDPSGGTNAGYPAASAYRGDLRGLVPFLHITPAAPVAPGAVGAYPSDALYGPDGVLYLLAYRVDGAQCTELLRYDHGLDQPPTVLPIGCLDDYAKAQFSRRGVLYILAAGASGAAMRLGVSADRGETWTWHDVALRGLPPGDTRFFGATPIKPYSSPGIYDPDRLVFFFSGYDAAGLATRSYLGVLPLVPGT